MPEWWNGIHSRLKICRLQGHTGSSPVSGTKGTTMSNITIEPQHDSEGTDDDFFDDIKGQWARMEAERRESDEFRVNNMEYDMSQADWFVSKVRGSDAYA